MKTPVLCLVIVAAGMSGLGGGWLLWGGKGTENRDRAPHAGTGRTPGGDTGSGAGTPRSVTETADAAAGRHAAEVMADELTKIKMLTPAEFGVAMTDVWLAFPDPENYLRRGLYLRALDGERAEKFYLEYKRRKGLGHWDNSTLGEFFTTTGSQAGRDFLERILKVSPNGFQELECVTHGWALTDARGAVDWLNALPEDAPYYNKALLGLMWGLAQNSPGQAMKVYATLDPAVAGGALASIGQSTVDNHGLKGLAELLSSIPDDKVREALFNHSLGYVHRKPPADFVREMAPGLSNSPWMQGQYNEKAGRWAAADPDAALSWLVQTAESNTNPGTIDKLAASLATQPGNAEALRSWVAAHPDAPGRPVIENALSPTPAAAIP